MKEAQFDFSKVAAVSGTGQVLFYHFVWSVIL